MTMLARLSANGTRMLSHFARHSAKMLTWLGLGLGLGLACSRFGFGFGLVHA